MHRILQATKWNQTTKVDGVEWNNKDARTLITYMHHSCESGRSFTQRVGLHLKLLDLNILLEKEVLDENEPVSIKDDPNDPVMKDKIIPFLRKVKLLVRN